MATTQQLLDAAKAAYHDLMIGRSARVVVDGTSGERVEFTAARKADLYAYIRELENTLATEQGTTRPNNAPMGFIF